MRLSLSSGAPRGRRALTGGLLAALAILGVGATTAAASHPSPPPARPATTQSGSQPAADTSGSDNAATDPDNLQQGPNVQQGVNVQQGPDIQQGSQTGPDSPRSSAESDTG